MFYCDEDKDENISSMGLLSLSYSNELLDPKILAKLLNSGYKDFVKDSSTDHFIIGNLTMFCLKGSQ